MEGGGTDFEAVLQAAGWGIFQQRPEKEGLAKKALQDASLGADRLCFITDTPPDLKLQEAFPLSSDPKRESHGDS